MCDGFNRLGFNRENGNDIYLINSGTDFNPIEINDDFKIQVFDFAYGKNKNGCRKLLHSVW